LKATNACFDARLGEWSTCRGLRSPPGPGDPRAPPLGERLWKKSEEASGSSLSGWVASASAAAVASSAALWAWIMRRAKLLPLELAAAVEEAGPSPAASLAPARLNAEGEWPSVRTGPRVPLVVAVAGRAKGELLAEALNCSVPRRRAAEALRACFSISFNREEGEECIGENSANGDATRGTLAWESTKPFAPEGDARVGDNAAAAAASRLSGDAYACALAYTSYAGCAAVPAGRK